MIDSTPMGFTEGNFDDVETSQGFAGQELVEEQWAVATLTEHTEFNYSGGTGQGAKKTPRIHMHVQLDKQMAGTPGRTYYDDLYLTPGCQAMIDGWCRALGVGLFSHRFGPGRDGDQRPMIDPKDATAVKQAGEGLASAFKKRRVIVAVGVETSKEKKPDGTPLYEDKNKTRGWYSLDDERTGTLQASGFMGLKAIAVRERKNPTTGKKESYFVAKPQAGEAARKGVPVAAGPQRVVEA